MRTNWFLAVLVSAITALAAPNLNGHGDNQEQSPKPYGQRLPAYRGYHTKLASSSTALYGKANETFSYMPTGTGTSSLAATTKSPALVTSVYYTAETTVTHYTTIFATVCTETERWSSQGTLYSSTYETTSTTSSVLHQTGTPIISQAGALGGGSASATPSNVYQHSGPEGASVTFYTTIYETVVPHEYTIVSGSSTISSSLYSPTTITAVVTRTVSLAAESSTPDVVDGGSSATQQSLGSAAASGDSDSGSSAAGEIAPAGQTSSQVQYGSITLTYATTSSVALSASSEHSSAESGTLRHGTAPVAHSTPSIVLSDSSTTPDVASRHGGDSLVTSFTTTYTTICPGTSTFHLNGTNSTSTTTYNSQTTITTVITSTILPSHLSRTEPRGSASFSIPVNGTGGGSVPLHPINTDSGSVSAVGTSTAAQHSTDPSSSRVNPAFTIGTGVTPGFPQSTVSGSNTFSRPLNATSSFSRVPTASVTTSPSFPSMSFPAGNGTISAPFGSGTGHIVSPTKSMSASNTSSACTHKPTSTDFCVPCEGQPGNDPNSFCGYTAKDNSYEVMPKTCHTVEYFFEMTNQTIAPDGVERMGLVINGQMPGPKIEAMWGDTIVVHVKNAMQNNGTSLHFHGIRQNYTNEMDGVASITQCALAPGEEMTYTFKASNYGTSWYHSHFALQTYEGIFGPMIIHGPHTGEYDVDAGMIVLQDWSHNTVDSMYDAAQTVGPSPQNGPRTLDTGLINGMNVWGSDDSSNQTGSRFELEFEPGKTYLLRVVNTAVQSTFKWHIDNHKFTVISNDFVPIVPYETDILNINIGQRYNVLVKADAKPGNYWMRSDNQQSCAQLINARDIKGIVHYKGFQGTPTSTAKKYTDECVDEPYASLVPYAPMTAGPEDREIHKNIVIGPGAKTPTLFKWSLSGTSFISEWGDASLPHIYNNGTVPPYSGNLAIEVPELHQWVYIIVESPIPLPHPIHLHGHDFFVLAQGTGPYSDSVALNTNNPPRRDVALMPWSQSKGLGGYLVLAFETDNPGAWLMHCHIGWHVSMGFALQIIENLEGISSTVTDSCQLDNTCFSWNKYATANDIHTEDSGV